MQQPTQVTTEFVRRHYSRGPTAYREDGSIARMPSADDIAYCELQFDQWLAAHDAEVLTRAGSPGSTGTRNQPNRTQEEKR